MKTFSLHLFLLLFLAPIFSFAGSSSLLNDVTKKYRTSPLVKMDVIKKVKSELLGKETVFSGQIFLAQNKFRWDNSKPEKTLLIFDGRTIWNVQYPPPELPGPPQVAKSRLDKNSRKQILISTLMSNDGIHKNFKVTSTDKKSTENTFLLVPKSNELSLKDLKIRVQSSNKTIVEITYKDDLGNETSLAFDKVEFSKKAKKDLFSFKPPKDAQVTNL